MSNIKYPIDLSSRQIKQFQTEILNWYKVNKRELPWRKSRDPYKILVSEVMLQQTQVSRVIPKYDAWLQRFPDVQSLANAQVAEVLKYWSGLGYNRRALYLLRCARELAKRLFPQTEKELIKLPGIGKYTARALLCFAFDKQIAVVDTNIRKVILTQFQVPKEVGSERWEAGKGSGRLEKGNSPTSNIKSQNPSSHLQHLTSKEIEQIAEQLLPIGKAYEWNQALMDYSSAMLKQHKIPIPKQSKFKDSDRFFRGAIIRFLIKYQWLSFEELVNLFKRDKEKIEKKRLEKILKGLEKDVLIIEENGLFSLP